MPTFARIMPYGCGALCTRSRNPNRKLPSKCSPRVPNMFPQRPRRAAQLSNNCRTIVQRVLREPRLGSPLAISSRVRSRFDRLAGIWSSSSSSRRLWHILGYPFPNIGPTRSNVGKRRPNLVKVGRCWANVGQPRQTCDQHLPAFANFDRLSAESGQPAMASSGEFALNLTPGTAFDNCCSISCRGAWWATFRQRSDKCSLSARVGFSRTPLSQLGIYRLWRLLQDHNNTISASSKQAGHYQQMVIGHP